MNLYEKIIEIMSDVAYLQKDDEVGKGRNAYKAISEEKVTTAVRQSMIKNKVVILPIKQETNEIFTEYEKENTYNEKTTIEKKQRLMTTVNTTYKIINAEKPEESIEVVSSGSGVDSQDKGIGKAMTYAYKYMLLRSFAIPTGNDPDKIHNDELDKQMNVIKGLTPKQISDKLMELDTKKIDAILKKYNVELIGSLADNDLEDIAKKMKWI